MTLRLGGDGAITGCTSLENPDLTVSGLTISGSFDAEKVLVASGTAAAPSYTFSGDTDNGLYYAGTNSIGLSTAGTNAILIDSSGRLLVGTTSGSYDFEVKKSGHIHGLIGSTNAAGATLLLDGDSNGDGAGSDYASLSHNSDGNLILENRKIASIIFRNTSSSTERMRIDSSGRLLVGTSSDLSGGDADARLQVNGDTGAQILLSRQDFGALTAGTLIGKVVFRSQASGVSETSALIKCEADATQGSGDKPGRLVFSTTADGASSPTERMRIDSLGLVGIGRTTDSTYNSYVLQLRGSDTNGTFLHISTPSDGDSVGNDGMVLGKDNNNGYLYVRESQPLTIGTGDVERMRIDSSGRLLVNRSATATNGALAQFSSSVGPHISVNNTGASSAFMLFQNSTSGDGGADGLYIGLDTVARGYLWNYESGIIFGNNGATVGQFIGTKLNVPGVYSGTTTGGGPVYVESDGDLLRYTSSLKYKTDVETLEDARADAILNCRPVWYRSKCENDIKTEGAEKSDWGWYGFIAEEVAEIEPRLVNWATKDSVEQEDKTTLSVERDPADYEAEGVRYDNFVPLMLNLIKRQKAQIETLEQRLSDAGIA